MPTSISLNPIIKKFIAFYVVLVILVAAVAGSVYSLYLSNISELIAEVSRNAVMINDTFTLKQNVSPLLSGDIFEVKIFNSIGQPIYFHETNKKFFLYASKSQYVDTVENPIFTVVIKASLLKISLLYVVLIAFMSLLYFPFRRFELKQYENQRNESIASLTRKVAHDIRSPISTLNLISSQISDENIKNLQRTVVEQITLIAEDLLIQNKSASLTEVFEKKKIVTPKSLTYREFFNNISDEYQAKKKQHQRNIKFQIDADIESKSVDQSKLIYPIVCNLLNNSIEATSELNSLIEVKVYPEHHNVVISIRDNGYGIPPDVLRQLGKKMMSYGKENSDQSGNGLALFNANKDLEYIGGFLMIDSEVNQFTEVKIVLPI